MRHSYDTGGVAHVDETHGVACGGPRGVACGGPCGVAHGRPFL